MVEDAIATADEFAHEQDDLAATRNHQLRLAAQQHHHNQRIARVWAPVVLLIVLGAFAWLAFVVNAVTTEHVQEHHKQVTVWCYADPNSDRGTSTITGFLDQVQNFCPDQRQPTYDPTQNNNP